MRFKKEHVIQVVFSSFSGWDSLLWLHNMHIVDTVMSVEQPQQVHIAQSAHLSSMALQLAYCKLRDLYAQRLEDTDISSPG